MRTVLKRGVLVLGCAAALGNGGCTLVKPLVGIVAGPAIILGDGGSTCFCGDGRAVAVAFVGMAAAGAVCGLVTGVISDCQVLFGSPADPTANWYDPLRTNTDPER